jgi:hypothetical protein
MIATALIRVCSGCLMAIVLAFAPSGSPQAADQDPFTASLASQFLQSRAQIRIYRYDDQADLACQSRSFVAAKVVRHPHVVDDTLNERKWIERWVMDRCGDQVVYDVYFTEVGKGGAIFSFLEVQ